MTGIDLVASELQLEHATPFIVRVTTSKTVVTFQAVETGRFMFCLWHVFVYNWIMLGPLCMEHLRINLLYELKLEIL